MSHGEPIPSPTRHGPTSIRWSDPRIPDRVAGFARAHQGMSASAAISTLVDEGLRMREHPAVVFRDGPMGRRAALAAGPDIWEVIRSLRAAQTATSGASGAERIQVVATNGGLSEVQVEAAIAYYSAYPDEVDDIVRRAEEAEQSALAAWERRQALLA